MLPGSFNLVSFSFGRKKKISQWYRGKRGRKRKRMILSSPHPLLPLWVWLHSFLMIWLSVIWRVGQLHIKWKKEFLIFEQGEAPQISKFSSEVASPLHLFNNFWVLHIMLSSEDMKTIKIGYLHPRDHQQVRGMSRLNASLHHSMVRMQMKGGGAEETRTQNESKK